MRTCDARGSKFQGCLRFNCCLVWYNCETPSSFFPFFLNRFSIMAPNMFHIGVEEKVSITVFDAGQAVTVKLYLQDYPQRQKTFSQVEGRVENGNPVFSPPSTCCISKCTVAGCLSFEYQWFSIGFTLLKRIA